MSLPERGRLDWPLQEPSFTYCGGVRSACLRAGREEHIQVAK